MLLNALRFGAKRKVKWCKMQGKMVRNVLQKTAKKERICINIHI